MTGAYCFAQGRVWRFYQRNKARLDPLSSTFNLKVELRNHAQIRLYHLSGLINLITPGGKQQTYVYNMRGVMEICRYSTQPKANAFIDCIP